jgi:hypothetical protein
MTSDNSEIADLKARVRELEAALGQGNKTLAAHFHLSSQNSNLLGLLVALDYVTPEVISERLQIASDAKVALHRLRRSLAEFGISIRARRNVGYWLDPATKVRIRDMLTSPPADITVVGPVPTAPSTPVAA